MLCIYVDHGTVALRLCAQLQPPSWRRQDDAAPGQDTRTDRTDRDSSTCILNKDNERQSPCGSSPN